MGSRRKICVLTVGRTDWSLWRPILDELSKFEDVEICLVATGMHLSPEFGFTVQDVEGDGYRVDERVELILSSDSPVGVATAMGLGNIGFSGVYERQKPDLLMVLGDRFETLSAVTAAMPFRIPVFHLYGGEATEGNFDELVRHAITKMSHVHFTSAEPYTARIRKGLGEEPWRVHTVGATSIDEICRTETLAKSTFLLQHNLDPNQDFLLVTFHPVTLEVENTYFQVGELLKVLEKVDSQLVITYPNADTSGRAILGLLREFQRTHSVRTRLVPSLGRVGYYSALRHAKAMIGNSSSGIVEAASFQLPVVNIGSRQRGRVRASNVVDVGYTSADITKGLGLVLNPTFRNSLENLQNPYGDGSASHRIVEVVRNIKLDQSLIVKVLHCN